MAGFYPYRYVQTFHERVGHLREKRLYSFTSTKSNLCYWVWVERYDCDVFAIKFHLKAHRLSPHKYQAETRTFEPRTIVLTCIQIVFSRKKSTYLMVNRHGLASDPGYISRIQEAFAEQYPYFE